MKIVELVNSINKVATDEGFALVARDSGVTSFIRIVSTKSGATWATMHRSLLQLETWKCYTEFPDEMLFLLKLAAPVFAKSKTKWPNGLRPEAYFEVDIGYNIIKEVVTLTNGEQLKGWVVSPPEITAERGAEYDLMRQKADMGGGFHFWEPGKALVSIIMEWQVKKVEVTEKSKDDDLD